MNTSPLPTGSGSAVWDRGDERQLMLTRLEYNFNTKLVPTFGHCIFFAHRRYVPQTAWREYSVTRLKHKGLQTEKQIIEDDRLLGKHRETQITSWQVIFASNGAERFGHGYASWKSGGKSVNSGRSLLAQHHQLHLHRTVARRGRLDHHLENTVHSRPLWANGSLDYGRRVRWRVGWRMGGPSLPDCLSRA